MKRKKMDFTQHYDQVVNALMARGLLLSAYDASGRANAMTIGWGALGNIWCWSAPRDTRMSASSRPAASP